MMLAGCPKGHSMLNAYVREGGRLECRTCYRYRVKSEANKRGHERRRRHHGDAPYATFLRTVPSFAPDDVVVVFSKELAEAVLPGLAAMAKGDHSGTARAAAWMFRAIKAELDGDVAHAGNGQGG